MKHIQLTDATYKALARIKIEQDGLKTFEQVVAALLKTSPLKEK